MVKPSWVRTGNNCFIGTLVGTCSTSSSLSKWVSPSGGGVKNRAPNCGGNPPGPGAGLGLGPVCDGGGCVSGCVLTTSPSVTAASVMSWTRFAMSCASVVGGGGGGAGGD